MIEQYLIHLLVLVGIYIILTLSLNLAVGYSGLLNLGHVALFGIGAYTSALLVIHGVPFLVAFIMAGLFAAFFGALLYGITCKLKGDYLVLATLGFSFVVYSVLINWVDVTRGPLGIPGIPKPELFGFTIQSTGSYLLFMIIIAGISVGLMRLIVRSGFGRLLQAARDDEVGLRVLGKNTYLLRYKIMAISGFFAGIAGSVYAHYISYIDPSSFSLTSLIFVVTAVIVGGLASLRGSIIAPAILILIPEALRFIDMPSSILGPLRQILYALILLGILLYRPRGICGRIDLQ
ncbi:branched-chain amino acid ABC transporter permease [Candidatus Woesearchaeota archaeon]|nr:branched-chain amino acid ABC transporter permease [Candidatus Woesearchaeota archaeon]